MKNPLPLILMFMGLFLSLSCNDKETAESSPCGSKEKLEFL